METIEIKGKDYEVIGHDKDGVPTIRGVATTTEVDGKISVNINVPPISIGVIPGKVE